MALEVGKLVARIELEGSFDKKLAAARSAMEETARAAEKLDTAVGKAGQSGAKIKIPDAPGKKLDDAARSAEKFDTAVNKAGDAGKKLTVSDAPASKLIRLESTTRDYGLSLDRAASAGKKLDVSDSPASKLITLESTARDYGISLDKATASGKNLDVSDSASSKLMSLESTARDYGISLDNAKAKGESLSVSEQPKATLSETASIADQVDSKFQSLGITMKGMALTAGAAGLGAVVMKGWDRVSAIDTAQGKLKGLGHETQAVAGIMDSALDSVKGTSYGLGDAATIAAGAVAAGIQPGKELTKYLGMTADASAIAGVSLDQMGRILNQVQTGQAAYTGDLNQLADRGIPIYQWLGEEAGVAASEIKKMASTGQISSEMLFSAIQKNIGGAAKEVGNTLVGSIANVGAAVGRIGAAAITPFKDVMLGAAEGVTGFADVLSSAVGPAASVAASGLGLVGKAVGLIPGPITAAVAALVALKVTGLGASMATAAATAGSALVGVGQNIALAGMFAKSSVTKLGPMGAAMKGMGAAASAAGRGLGSIVNMLGGPWMIGLAAAGYAISTFVSASSSASAAQDKLAAASADSAAAQNELAYALAKSNGAMSEQAVAAAQRIVQASLDETNAKAEQSHNIFSQTAVVLGRVGSSYNDFASVAENATSSMDRNAAATEMAKLENQALGDASAEAGTKVEDAAQIAANGGPQWDSLKAALMRTGEAGEAVIGKLEGARAEIDMVRASVASAEPGSHQLAEAFRVMADEAAGADEKASALKAALDALTGGQMSARDAAQAHNDEIRKIAESTSEVWDATDGWGDALVQNGNEINTTTANGSKLRDTITGLIDSTVQAASSGADMNEVWASNGQALEALATATGLPIEKIRELAAAEGLLTKEISIAAALNGGNEVVADLARVAAELDGVPPGKTIEVAAPSEAAIAELRAAGWQVDAIPGSKNVNVTASSEAARVGLLETSLAAARLDALAPNVSVDTNAEWVTHALGITAQTTEGLPPGHVEITDTTPENIARLEGLGIKVHEPKNGVVTINDQDVNRARDNVNTLNNNNTSSTHTVYIGTVNRGGNDQSSGGTTVGQHYGANGGFLPTQSFADGGLRTDTLPDAAVIAQPQGTRGLVQWAEAETQGEAFIPLAKSKRARSLEIWKETGRRLGALGKFANGGILPDGDGQKGDIGGLLAGKFADGGIMAGGLIDFAKGVEGKPYVWGGVNWGDCSGAVSALANYVSGRSHFGSRFATGNEREALADRGFVSGRGGPGDLQIGWFNGGPYGGHTAATLPDGTNFEMGGGRGNGQFGGPAAGADDGQFTDHAYFPMSRFADIDAALGGSAYESIAAQLGQGNPEMANVPDNRTPRQKNIDAIVAEGERRKMSDRDIQVALMTAEQESGIRVLNNPADAPSMSMDAEGTGYDGTSTGIFQQQNNGAWGTLEDRMDPTKSAGMFYDALSKVEGRDQMSLTKAAQTVQGSAHPDAYAKHEGMASEELAASKKRLETLASQSSGGGKGGKGQAVYVTNWPSGGGSYGGGSSAAISEAASAVGAAEDAAFIQENSIASFLADQAGRRDLVQKSDGGVSVTAFADGGFHGIENHSAHIAPAGSWRIFGEPETGGEAYIPLASNKRARSLDIWMETGKRLGMTGLGIAGVAGSLLTGGGLSTGWNGPSMSDLGIDTGALGESLKPGVAAQAEAAGQQVAEILSQLGAHIETSVDGTLQQANAQSHRAKQQYARAMI